MLQARRGNSTLRSRRLRHNRHNRYLLPGSRLHPSGNPLLPCSIKGRFWRAFAILPPGDGTADRPPSIRARPIARWPGQANQSPLRPGTITERRGLRSCHIVRRCRRKGSPGLSAILRPGAGVGRSCGTTLDWLISPCGFSRPSDRLAGPASPPPITCGARQSPTCAHMDRLPSIQLARLRQDTLPRDSQLATIVDRQDALPNASA